MVIRPLEVHDLPAVRALLGTLIRQHADREPGIIRPVEELDPYVNGTDPETTLRLVAVDGDRVVGFAQGALEVAPSHPALCERKFFGLYDLVVDPSVRRRGIASKLLEACAAWAREHDAPDIELNVFTFNEEALRFYERHGFRILRHRLTRGS